MKEKLVLIGNGMAGVRTIEEILDRDSDRYQITIIGEEKYPNYNRIMLSNVLQKKMTVSEIITNPLEWYEENQIELINHDPAVGLETTTKKIITKTVKAVSILKSQGPGSICCSKAAKKQIAATGTRLRSPDAK